MNHSGLVENNGRVSITERGKVNARMSHVYCEVRTICIRKTALAARRDELFAMR